MSYYLNLVQILIASFIIMGCDSQENCKSKSPFGTWKSIGYGRLIEIDSSEYEFYDFTKISCIPVSKGKYADISDAIEVKNDTLYYQVGFDIYSFKRFDNIPIYCQETERESSDPKQNIEVFAQTIKENYVYFDLNNIDWDFIYPYYEEKINNNTTDEELYLIFEEMIDTLKDNHGYIEPSDKVLQKIGPSQNASDTGIGDFVVARVIADNYLEKELSRHSKVVRWGVMGDNIGYIQINAMWLHANLHMPDSVIKRTGYVNAYENKINTFSEVEILKKEIDGIRYIMNEIMNDLINTRYIIIDVRFNGGGYDDVSLEILKCFNNKKKKIASKRARTQNSYTKESQIYLDRSKSPYNNQVIILTSQQSASATDFLALASMAMENVVRIGSKTQGALSDALEKRLPNGWYFTLSNEEYFDLNGKCYENKGIPVHYELNYPDDRQLFFQLLMEDPQKDKQKILNAIESMLINNQLNVGMSPIP